MSGTSKSSYFSHLLFQLTQRFCLSFNASIIPFMFICTDGITFNKKKKLSLKGKTFLRGINSIMLHTLKLHLLCTHFLTNMQDRNKHMKLVSYIRIYAPSIYMNKLFLKGGEHDQRF